MDIDDDTLDALFALIGLSIFFIFAAIGMMVTSTNEDSGYFIEFVPPEDYLIIFGLLMIDIVFMFYYLLKTFKFRQSGGLDKRYGELLVTSDKMLIYTFLFFPVEGAVIFYYIKYFTTSIALYLFIVILLQIGLIILIFYNSLKIRRDYKEEQREK